MTMYEVRITQKCRDYYRVDADSPADAEKQVWASISAQGNGTRGKLTPHDTYDCSPRVDYTVQLSPEGEPIL